MELDIEEKFEIICDCFKDEYNIPYEKAREIIIDMDLRDILEERYEDEIIEYADALEKEWEYDHEHYADGWSDHVGV